MNKVVPREIEPEWARAMHDLELEAATRTAMPEPEPEAEINLQELRSQTKGANEERQS